MSLIEEKQALRCAIRARLAAQDQEERAMRSSAACTHLIAHPAFAGAGLLLAYCATPQECDPKQAVEAARAAGKRVAFPLCLPGNQLALYEPLTSDALVPGKYGIFEPVPARSRHIAPEEVEFAIIPALAMAQVIMTAFCRA